MAYKVVRFFYDLQDADYQYNVGDSFPRKGKTVSDKRIEFLASNKNRLGTPVIVKTEEPKRKRKGE